MTAPADRPRANEGQRISGDVQACKHPEPILGRAIKAVNTSVSCPRRTNPYVWDFLRVELLTGNWPRHQESGRGITHNFTCKFYIQGKERANSASRRQVIFVRRVVVHAVVFQCARQSPRQWFPAGCFLDELACRHHADEIAREFFGALSLNPQSGAHRRARCDCAKQRSQRFILAACDVGQLVSEDAYHGFI